MHGRPGNVALLSVLCTCMYLGERRCLHLRSCAPLLKAVLRAWPGSHATTT